MPKLLFLSSHFTSYFHDCLHELTQNHGFEVIVIRWQSSNKAPVQFPDYQNITIKTKTDFTQKELSEFCLNFEPDIVFFPGWMDKDYLKIVSQLHRKGTKSIMGFDNQWRGTFKQKLLTFLGYELLKVFIKPDYVWVPGINQREYVSRIGFPKNQILMGLYSANQPVFDIIYQKFKAQKTTEYPKTFVYIGRFSPEKNPEGLYNVFKEIIEENLNKDWSLTMIGVGIEGTNLETMKNIEIKGFVQAQELPQLLSSFGCFVCPSLSEQWGVAIHEAVSAGLPLVSTSAAGANSVFLKEDFNGFSFETGSHKSLKEALLKVINLDNKMLIKMSERSAELSFQLTPSVWANTLKNTLSTHKQSL